LAITRSDILSGLKKIKVCTGYRLKGKKIQYTACGYDELAKLKPVYQTLPGWNKDIKGITKWNTLPLNCQNYLRFIERYLEVKISIVSTGPDRDEFIRL